MQNRKVFLAAGQGLIELIDNWKNGSNDHQCGCSDMAQAEGRKLHSHFEWLNGAYGIISEICTYYGMPGPMHSKSCTRFYYFMINNMILEIQSMYR